jgi:hypothetical protein
MKAMDEGYSRAPARPLFTSRRHLRRSAGQRASAFVLLMLFAGTASAGWYWLATRGGAGDAAQGDARTADAAASGGSALAPELPLPPLAASDAAVRALVGALSAHPELAAWLATDELIRRFVNTVVALARGSSPAAHLPFAAPVGAFRAEISGGRPRIAQESYRRYDLASEAFASLDAAGAAALYRRLHPLFEEAYAELGVSVASFDEMAARAVANVLAVEVPDRPAELVQREGLFAFRDPRLEARTPAEKQLLRMGPDNARRVQDKLEEIARAAGIPSP